MAIQIKRGSLSEWESTNPELEAGQLALVTNINGPDDYLSAGMKVGTGIETYNDLEFLRANELVIPVDTIDLNSTTGPSVTTGTYYTKNLQNGPNTLSTNYGWLVKVYRLVNSDETIFIKQELIVLSTNSANDYSGPLYYVRFCPLTNISSAKFVLIPTYTNNTSSNPSLYTSGIMYISNTLRGNLIQATKSNLENLVNFENTIENGTWTPEISASGSINYASATYTRIGQLCYIQLSGIFEASITGVSTALYVSGLPFMSYASNSLRASYGAVMNVSIYPNNNEGHATISGTIDCNALNDSLYFFVKAIGGASSQLTHAMATSLANSNYTWVISGVYRIDS